MRDLRTVAPRLTPSPIINVMLSAVEKAARGLLRDFGEVSKLQVSRKGPGNFVSAADKRSEEIIVSTLQKAYPTYAFLTEERGVILPTLAEETSEETTHRWIVDPLDGTTNFLHGLPHFCISIALEEKGELVAGLIYDPFKDECFWAEKGKGAYLNHEKLRTSKTAKLSDILVGVGIPCVAYGQVETFLKQAHLVSGRVAGTRCSGSGALDLAYVAAGRLDAYWEGVISPWDMAAGILIAREAGALVTDIHGGEDPLNAGSVFAANPELHQKLAPVVAVK